jgi:hypothetical protein
MVRTCIAGLLVDQQTLTLGALHLAALWPCVVDGVRGVNAARKRQVATLWREARCVWRCAGQRAEVVIDIHSLQHGTHDSDSCVHREMPFCAVFPCTQDYSLPALSVIRTARRSCQRKRVGICRQFQTMPRW